MTAALWTGTEVRAATAGRGPDNWSANGVSIDTRTIEPGDLFVALAGPNFDGHDYLPQAFEKRAAAALVHRGAGDASPGPLITVSDTLEGLRALGRAGRERSAGKVVGLTGSVGKTGSKEALRAALGAQGRCFASASSLNNHWGVPLSLSRMPKDSDFGVFEMGMNHAGEIADLTSLVRPDVALITNIGVAHIEYFDSRAGIADAKSEIFQGIVPGGVAVLPRDDDFFDRLAAAAAARGVNRIVTFGRHPDSDIRLEDAQLHATCSAVTAAIKGHARPLEFCLALPGGHWVINALGVLAVVKALGLDLVTAAAEFARLVAMKGRGARQRLELPGGGGAILIDDSYNANPASVKAALAVLGRAAAKDGGRRIAVLGDMLELGAEAAEMHATLSDDVMAQGIDLVFTCGPMMGGLAEALPAERLGAHAPDSGALAEILVPQVRNGDVILVKGSLGSRMARVVEALEALSVDSGDHSLPRAVNGN
jgi:UDP-N-acetylmuramoyl-tripeptide--D-alanyl-D-alanine ligase